MEELYSMSVTLHWVFVLGMLLLAGVNLFFIIRHSEYITFAKKVQFVTPQYYMVMAALFFTGLIAMTVREFTMSVEIAVMILAWLFILLSSIRSYKIYKKTDSKDEEGKRYYRSFAKKKFLIDIALLSAVTLFSYLV